MGRSIDDVARSYRYFVRQYAGGKSTELDDRRVRQTTRRHRAAIARTQSICGRTITVLRRFGVENADFPMYVAYAQKLYRLGREQFCLTLANEARVLTNYWAARGMDPVVLAGVCREVLGFAPGEPGERPCGGCGRGRNCTLASQ